MSHADKLVAYLRVDEQDSDWTIELRESHSKVDDGREDYKSETHDVDMHMDEEDVTKIVEREVEASMCEIEQEHVNSQTLHCDVDVVDNGESHYEKTCVDDDCKVKCALVNLATANEFDDAEIVNEHTHAQISHHRVDEHYGNEIF